MTDPVSSSESSPSDIRQRLHPLSPLLRSIKALGVVIAGISWQGFARFGLTTAGTATVCAAVVALIWSWVAWRYTGYWIVARELHINDGVLSRRHRTIPLERLQSVEVVQPFLARLLGLAELRSEVVGATKSEAPLAYLTLDQAHSLRTRLLSLSKTYSEPALAEPDTDTPTQFDTKRTVSEDAAAATTTPLATVPASQLIYSQLLTPQVLILPFAVAVTIAAYWWNPDATFYGIAGLVSAVAGIAFRPVRQAMVDYDFTIGHTADGLRIRRGLTERRTQTLPLNRVTAVTMVWPLLWRGPKWVNGHIDNAGQAASAQNQQSSGGTLLPVGSVDQLRALSVYALSGTDMLAAQLSGTPRRARWCAPFQQPVLRATVAGTVFIAGFGRITPKLVAVPCARIQSVRVTQGRLQRVLNVATVHVDVAGRTWRPVQAKHRDVAEALWMAQELRNRSGQQN